MCKRSSPGKGRLMTILSVECCLPLRWLAVPLNHKPNHFQRLAFFSEISRQSCGCDDQGCCLAVPRRRKATSCCRAVQMQQESAMNTGETWPVSRSPARNVPEPCAGVCLGDSHTSAT